MADIDNDPILANLIPVEVKKRRTKKALKPKTSTSSEANILAGAVSELSPNPVMPLPDVTAGKENCENLSQPLSQKKTKKGASKSKQQSNDPFGKELQAMQEKLQQLRLEKEQTQDLLKAREEALKQKEVELETRDKEQEKLHMELKKLQKMKEFKPNMVNFPFVQSLKDKEQGKEKKKGGCAQKKRPSPPYALWCKDHWNEVKQAHPDAEFKEVSNILGAKWKMVSDDEKKPYEERYRAEKEAYLKIVGNEKRENEAMKLLEEEQKQRTAMELLEQYLQFKQEAEKDNKKTKKARDPMKPKQPMSSFFIFSNERRANLLAENKNVLEVAKIAGEEWKNMTEEQKSTYEELAKKNKEQYVQEMEFYKKKKDEEAANLKREEDELIKLQKQEALQLLKKKEKTDNIIKKTKETGRKKKKDADPNKPKRPASSFLLFSKETRKMLLEERPGINNSTLTALISVKWKELSESSRQVWNDKAAEAMEAYKMELKEYSNHQLNAAAAAEA